jgi:hypothetical protein
VDAVADPANVRIHQDSSQGISVGGANTFSLMGSPARQSARVLIEAEDGGTILFKSNVGTSSTGTLLPGTNIWEFVIEPQPDQWYCENDTGDPPHPVYKGAAMCPLCGGRVLKG